MFNVKNDRDTDVLTANGRQVVGMTFGSIIELKSQMTITVFRPCDADCSAFSSSTTKAACIMGKCVCDYGLCDPSVTKFDLGTTEIDPARLSINIDSTMDGFVDLTTVFDVSKEDFYFVVDIFYRKTLIIDHQFFFGIFRTKFHDNKSKCSHGG
jgi:hypothetical protein